MCQDVCRSTGQNRQRDVRMRHPIGNFIDGSVTARRHNQFGALRNRLLCQQAGRIRACRGDQRCRHPAGGEGFDGTLKQVLLTGNPSSKWVVDDNCFFVIELSGVQPPHYRF